MKKIFYIFLILSCGVWAQPKITASEYYWGIIDPGNGNGIPLSVEDSVFDEVVESVVTTYINSQSTLGPVLFNIRVKDVNNQWGPTFKKVIFILPGDNNSFSQVNLTKFEYFFGNFDPGEGLGTTIIAYDGALDEAVETVFRSQVTWDVTSGPILFNIRAKDSENKWGPLFKKTVFPYGANPNENLIQQGDAIQICPNSSVTLNYAGPNGYTPTWFDGSHGQSITFIPTSEGDYSVSATLDFTTFTDVVNITFKPLPIATITPSGQVLVCASSNFNLVANSGTNLTYQWTLNGNTIVSGINANYLPTATGSYAVKVTDSSTGCTKTSDVTVLSSSFLMNPNGTTSFCGSQLLSVSLGSSNGYQWKKDGVIISGATSSTYLATSSGSYTCVITNGSCTSTTSTTILSTTSAPTGTSSQTFSTGNTLANLVVTGTNIQWYSSSTSSTPLANTTLLVNGTTYYASQTLNGCEGTRLAVTVQVQLGIADFNTIKISYSPNPVTNFLDVKSNEILKSVSIMNALGQIVYFKNFNNTDLQLDLANLSAGSYFIKVQSDEKQNIFKIIKK
ncbi:MAG: T9SS type A sorting domain-containing protein [Flavobacterium sp.]